MIAVEEYDELLSLITTGRFDHLLEEHIQTNFYNEALPGPDMPSHRAQELLRNILTAEKHTAHLMPGIFRKKKTARWYMAAIITGMLAITTWLLLVNNKKDLPATVAETRGNNMIEKTNTFNHALTVNMEDGSMVTLQPGSTINFPQHFHSDKREIYLAGEAFFKVSKNPGRPFLVYYNNLVTHVLGTSFNIKPDSLISRWKYWWLPAKFRFMKTGIN